MCTLPSQEDALLALLQARTFAQKTCVGQVSTTSPGSSAVINAAFPWTLKGT